MPEVVNTWTGGLQKDLSKSVVQNSSYLDARNIRVLNDKDNTATAIINIKGNSLFASIPNTFPIYKFTIGSTGSVVITIDSQTASPFTVTSSTTGQDIYNFMADPTNGLSQFGTDYKVYIGNNHVTMVSTTKDITPSTSIGSLVTSTLTTGSINPEVIGWTTIRDDIYLLTTDDTSDLGGIGQIWKLDYDRVKLTTSLSTAASLTLVYEALLNFTKKHPIPSPGAIVGNYENTITQKIYWTNNFNRLRSINVADPNVFATAVDLLENSPSVVLDVLILEEIVNGGGMLRDGCYNLFYRYTNTGGATTVFSEISNTINIVVYSETTGSVENYYASGPNVNTTNKIIKVRLDNVDTNYDRIQLGYTYRTSLNGSPEIKMFADEPVTIAGPVFFNLTGSETLTDLTLNELLGFNDGFTHCKSLVTKDNLLIVGNVRREEFDLNFDTRAYRWAAQGYWSTLNTITDPFGNIGYGATKTRVQTSSGQLIIVDTSLPKWNVPDTHDAMTPRQAPFDVNNGAISFDTSIGINYKFQSDGTTIGGSGPNVSYKLLTSNALTSTNNFGADDTFTNLTPFSPYGLRMRLPARKNSTITLNSKVYNSGNFYDCFQSPYYQDLIRGYQREELYRFGIQFYDKQGRGSFVKWIADIMMPSMYEIVDNIGTISSNYVFSSVSGTTQSINNLGVQFTVDTTSIKDQISAFSIVRVKREESDKTIKAAGLVFLCDRFSGSGNELYVNWRNTVLTGDNNTSCSGTATVGNYITLQSPEVGLGMFPAYRAGDTLRAVAVMNGGSGSASNFNIYKEYAVNNTVGGAGPRVEIPVNTQVIVGRESSTTLIDTSTILYNRTLGDCGSLNDGTQSRSQGELTVAMKLNSSLTIPSGSESYKYYAYYYRPITDQYSGNSYSQRAGNSYMICNHYRMVNDNTPDIFTEEIYGGDTFITLYDNQKFIKNWHHAGGGITKESVTYYFPVESEINTEWRTDSTPGTVNRDGMLDNGTLLDLGEFYGYINAYSNENSTKDKLPKPIQFTNIDVWDTRVWVSEVKTAGELTDSWGIFKSNNWRDVDSIYGPINNLVILKNNLLYFQDKAFGIIPVNQRIVIPDTTDSSLLLGTGEVLEKHEYISTQSGCKHQWGMTVSDDSVFYFDIIDKRLNSYQIGKGLEFLSVMNGMNRYFLNNLNGNVQLVDNPVYVDSVIGKNGITATYDYNHKEAIFTFFDYVSSQNSITISYSQQLEKFISFYDYYPSMYINDKSVILTSNPSLVQDLYINEKGNYCNFYGKLFNSIIKLIVNPGPTQTKVFRNFEAHSEVKINDVNQLNEFFNSIRCYTDYQNTDFITLIPGINLKRAERTWQLAVPRDKVIGTVNDPDIFSNTNLSNSQLFKKELKDKYMIVDLVFNNTLNKELVFHYLKTLYAISPR